MSWGETMKIIRSVDKRLDGTDAGINEVKAKTEEINANVLKKQGTIFTYSTVTLSSTAEVTVLSVSGSGMLNSIGSTHAATSNTYMNIYVDGVRIGYAALGTATSGSYLIVFNGYNNSFTFRDVGVLTNPPPLNIFYAKSFLITVGTTSVSGSRNFYVNYTKEG